MKSHGAIRSAMKSSSGFVIRDAHAVRDMRYSREVVPMRAGFVRYSYRPLDNRWLYWEAEAQSCLVRPCVRLPVACVRGKRVD